MIVETSSSFHSLCFCCSFYTPPQFASLFYLFRNEDTMMMGVCGIQRDLTPQERVTNEWDQMAGEWDDLAVGYAARFERLLWNKLPDNTNTDTWYVLDFGSGTGLLSDRLRHKVKQIVAIDASSKMIEILKEKIQSQEWGNTTAIPCVLANLDNEDTKPQVRESVEAMYGTIDLIVASSVLTFIPENDVTKTMEILGKFLKAGGWLVHSDWPKSEAKHPDAMDTENAHSMYIKAGLVPVSTEIVSLDSDGSTMDVFFGVAQKET